MTTIHRLAVMLVAVMLLVPAIAGAAGPSPLEAFFERHCYSCHSGNTPEAELDLAVLSRNLSDPAIAKRFVRIHDRIAAGEMPPKDEERPNADELLAVTQWLDQELATADAARIAENGRARMRRMTRSEYENTLRDLLCLEWLDIKEMLPRDDEVAGFDKVAEALDLSPVHLAAYAEAADRAVGQAIATRSTPPPVYRKRIPLAGQFKFHMNLINGNFVLLKDGKPDPALPFRGGFEEIKGIVAKPNADEDLKDREKLYAAEKIAESTSSVGLLAANGPGFEAALNVAPIYAGRYRLRLSIWGVQWNQGKVEPIAAQAAAIRAHEEGKQQEGGRLLGTFTAASLKPSEHEITAWINPLESIVFDPASLFWRGLTVRQLGGRAAKYDGPGVVIDWFEIEGPINRDWPPESHRRLFGDLPIRAPAAAADTIPPQRKAVRGIGGYLPNYYTDIPVAERKPPLETVQSKRPLEDARRLLQVFLPRAFRRPVMADEGEPYVALVRQRLEEKDCFEDAMRRAYVAVLTSPEMLFHPADARGDAESMNAAGFALASRLAYWLWNGPPDEQLMAAARAGSLRDPQVLHAQVDRLLADPRSDRFIDDFTDQWLELNRIDETTPDRFLYPEYSWLLGQGMVAESRAFLRECITKDLPIRTLVDADFVMVTQRLAEHYGLKGIEGVDVQRVSLPKGSHRGGLLTQASILKLTANGTTTSPVKRGVWVLDRLFNMPPPPPPPGISAIDPDTRGTATIREQLDRHRADRSCAVCHAKIDPPGFALECFDPVGSFRTRYRSTEKGDPAPPDPRQPYYTSYKLGPKVDASGGMSNGKRFKDVDDFKQLLADHPRGLAKAFVGHLVRYATGADLSYADRRAIAAIVAEAKESGYGIRSLVHAVAGSELFTGAAAITKGQASRESPASAAR